MTDIDTSAFQEHLAAERRERGLDLNLAVFDETRHPRGFHGRFASAVGGAKSLSDVFGQHPGQALDTHKLFTDHSGNYTPHRQALHDQIIDDLFAGHKPKPKGQRHVLLTAGGSASGKSRLVDEHAPTDSVHIDSDVIKDQLPEYRHLVEQGDDRAAAIAHEESSRLAKRAYSEALKRGYNATFDGTGGGDSHLQRIDQAHAAGHKVHVHVATVPTDLAQQINVKRAEKTGRLVPESFLREAHANVSRTFGGVHARKDKLHSLVVHDHSEKGKPRKIAELYRSQLHVHDGDAFMGFLNKAHEIAK